MSTETQSKLTFHQKQTLQLIARSERDEFEFAKASRLTWPLIAQMPDELVEKYPRELKCRLTQAAKIILKYL